MARSLAKIKQQIEKLQKEADSIQATVVARIRREIAQYGLTSEHLFGTFVGNGRKPAAAPAKAPKKAGVEKPAKYADSQGNTWHGMGKRPSWIHAALAAGSSLEDFLVGASKAPRKQLSVEVSPARAATKRVAKKKSPVTRKAVKAPKVATKQPAAKAAASNAKKSAPVRKASKAKATSAEPSQSAN